MPKILNYVGQLKRTADTYNTDLPIGTIIMWSSSTLPSGYIECDGSAISRTTYSDLFDVIGTTWGVGDGSTTFNLPDFRGRTPTGIGTGTGGGASGTGLISGGSSLTSRALASWFGAETHTLTIAEMPAHTHSVLTTSAWNAKVDATPVTQPTGGGTSGSTGGGGAHNNIQPSISVRFIIKWANITTTDVTTTFNFYASSKNIVINGDFNVWQRGTSFSSVASSTYTADRFIYVKSTAAVHTISRSTDVPTVAQSGHLSSYSVLIDCTTVDSSIAAGDICYFGQHIEGFNWASLAQQICTLSFWVKATKTGTYCVSLRNNGGDRAYVAEYTVDAADTWEKKTIVIPASPSGGTWDYTNGLGVTLAFCLLGGSTYQTTPLSWQTGNYLCTANQVNSADSTSNNVQFAQIQLELGGEATEFDFKSFQTELALCQRYYSTSYDYGTVAGTATFTGSFHGPLAHSSNSTNVSVRLPVTMRSTPTVTAYNPSTGTSGQFRDTYNAANVTAYLSYQGQNHFLAYTNSGYVNQNLYGHYTASAEF